LRTQVGELHQMPLNDNEADTLFLMEVLEHLDPSFSNQVFSELRRVIKPNGILVITVPNEENLNANKMACPECGCVFHQVQHLRSFSVDTLTTLMKTEGFQPVFVKSLNFNDYSGDILQRIAGFLRKLLAPYRRHHSQNHHLIAIGKRVN